MKSMGDVMGRGWEGGGGVGGHNSLLFSLGVEKSCRREDKGGGEDYFKYSTKNAVDVMREDTKSWFCSKPF